MKTFLLSFIFFLILCTPISGQWASSHTFTGSEFLWSLKEADDNTIGVQYDIAAIRRFMDTSRRLTMEIHGRTIL